MLSITFLDNINPSQLSPIRRSEPSAEDPSQCDKQW